MFTRIILLLAALTLPSVALADFPSSPLRARISTNRGCLETGHSATFTEGENILATLRIYSSSFTQANATLFSFRSNGFATAFGLGALTTNAFYTLAARVGSPPGLHRLLLKAQAGSFTSVRACTFQVLAASTTQTPQPTRTPTATRSPSATRTASATPNGTPGLQPHVRTNRGCQETGDDPVFAVGETVTVRFDILSSVVPHAYATLFDQLPNGFVNNFSFGLVATNQTFSFVAAIAPPSGTEVLKLRASSPGLPAMSSFCSFTVVSFAPTRTRTRTPTRTPTPTATATATP